jgi:hypothetical protein
MTCLGGMRCRSLLVSSVFPFVEAIVVAAGLTNPRSSLETNSALFFEMLFRVGIWNTSDNSSLSFPVYGICRESNGGRWTVSFGGKSCAAADSFAALAPQWAEPRVPPTLYGCPPATTYCRLVL